MGIDLNIGWYFNISSGVQPVRVPPSNVAIVMVDMWNSHWSPFAVQRAAVLAPVVNGFLSAARERCIPIIHAPSGCQNFYRRYPQLTDLYAVLYKAGDWIQKVTNGDIGQGAVWRQRPWLYQNFDPSGKKLYEDGTDEAGHPDSYYFWDQSCMAQNPIIAIEPPDQMVIDGFNCPNRNCPGFKTNDGHFHLAQFLFERGIYYLLFIGIHTNYCVVFTRPYSLWPMCTFQLKSKPDWQAFECVLVKDLTDSFIHPVNAPPDLTHYSGTQAFINWLMLTTNKNNFDPNKGVVASTVSWAELMNFYNPS
jgi:nicotinamidase-related amidase